MGDKGLLIPQHFCGPQLQAFVFIKNSRNMDKVLEGARRATAHDGRLRVDALAEEFTLLGTSSALLIVRSMQGQKQKPGFSSEAIVAQGVLSFWLGGTSLSDAGCLRGDGALGELPGMERWADDTTVGKWLRAQDAAALREF